jgi:hypothetical protein
MSPDNLPQFCWQLQEELEFCERGGLNIFWKLQLYIVFWPPIAMTAAIPTRDPTKRRQWWRAWWIDLVYTAISRLRDV